MMPEGLELPSPLDIERVVRAKLEAFVDGLPPTVGVHDSLLLVGVTSIDLIVVLSLLEQHFNISLDDAFVVQGYTIGNIAERVLAALRRPAPAGVSLLE